MLAAHAHFKPRFCLSAFFSRDADELPHGFFVDGLERVGREEVVRQVEWEEGAHIVAREAKRHLCQVVGAVREELCARGCDGGREKGGSRHFDHGADLKGERLVAFGEDRFGRCADQLLLVLELAHRADQRDHHLGLGVAAALLHVERSLDDCAHLHLRDLRPRDSESASAQAKHWVALAHVVDGDGEVGHAHFDGVGQLLLGLLR
mmetsp:Transcript_18912/g.40088  ORF Transcript_18912/g.40088 Transcript_18912/m.40088 type:complete len:206 (+) Transcript_18912:1134-1751(+)